MLVRSLAAIISPVLSGMLIDKFGSWELPFVGSMLLMAAGVFLAFRMRPEAKFETTHPPGLGDARPQAS